MYQKILKYINQLLRIRLRFDFPKKNKILLFDEIHASTFKKIIKKDFNILELRDNKKIYFWLFLKQILFLDFSFSTYSKNFIKFTSPKIIITFNEARYQLYELKNFFKNIHFISVSNGIRLATWFKVNEKKWPKNLKCDYFFVFNKYYIPKYEKIVKSKYLSHGHFYNNLIPINKTKFRKQFLYLSQTHEGMKGGMGKADFAGYKKILNLVNLYLTKNKKKLHILLRRSKKNPKQSIEINFYKKIFKSNCIFHQSNQREKKYKILDQFENILFFTSTMGYEAISRKKKIACLGPHNSDTDAKHYFGWPDGNKKKYEYFFIKKPTYNEVDRVLNNLINCSQVNWNKKHYRVIKNQMYLNKNNQNLRQLIFKLLKNK